MNNAARIAVVAAAFSALAAIACSSAPSDTVAVEVEQGTVDPNCIKGGITCGVKGGGSSGLATSSSGLVMDPGVSSGGLTPTPPLQPPYGVDPISCGESCLPTRDGKDYPACDCRGAGNGLQSNIVCPVATPCRYNVWGAYRCYQVDLPSNTCH